MPLYACWRYEQQGRLTHLHTAGKTMHLPFPHTPSSLSGASAEEVPSWLSLLSLIIHLFIRQMHEEPLVYARLASGMDRRSTARWREGQKDRQTNQQIPDNLTDSKGGVLRSTEELNRPGKFPPNS